MVKYCTLAVSKLRCSLLVVPAALVPPAAEAELADSHGSEFMADQAPLTQVIEVFML